MRSDEHTCREQPGCRCPQCRLWDQLEKAGLGDDDRIVATARPANVLVERYQIAEDGSVSTIASCVVDTLVWSKMSAARRGKLLRSRLAL